MKKKEVITAGALVRGYIRRFMLQQGIDFKEEKGLLESKFYVDKEDVPEIAAIFMHD